MSRYQRNSLDSKVRIPPRNENTAEEMAVHYIIASHFSLVAPGVGNVYLESLPTVDKKGYYYWLLQMV